jgi:hypothetical protein
MTRSDSRSALAEIGEATPTRRSVLSTLGAAALGVGSARKSTAQGSASVQFGLTPVLLTSDLELLAGSQSHSLRQSCWTNFSPACEHPLFRPQSWASVRTSPRSHATGT